MRHTLIAGAALAVLLAAAPVSAQVVTNPPAAGGSDCTTTCAYTGTGTYNIPGTTTKALVLNMPTSSSVNAWEVNLNGALRAQSDAGGNLFANSYTVTLGQNFAWNGRNQIGGGSSGCTSTFQFQSNSSGTLTAGMTPATTNGWMQMGFCNTATPAASGIQGEGSRAGTDTNVAGADFTVRAQAGTGTAAPPVLHLAGPVPVASGSSVQTYADGLRVWYGVARLTSYTVAGLPACATVGAGSMAFVTDATAPTYNGTLTGGGAVGIPVACDGTAWHSV